jgi:uncharacterized protein YbjQ (UPF0145 family)
LTICDATSAAFAQRLDWPKLDRRAEDIDADAIIGFDYETDGIVSVEGTGIQLKRILATGVAVKLSCAA